MKQGIYLIVILLFFTSGCCFEKKLVHHTPIQKSRGVIQISKETAKSIGLKTELVEKKKIGFQLRFNGIVKSIPYKTFYIASPVKGRILKVYVEPNQQITKSQLLCEIASQDVAELQLNINEKLIELEGNIEEAKLELSLKENTYNREKDLFEHGITAKKEFLEAENEYKIAQTNLSILEKSKEALEKLAEKRLSIIGSDLKENINNGGYVQVKASENGLVLKRLINPGEVVDENKVLFEASDLSEIYLESNVYEKDIPEILIGEKVVFTAEAYPDKVFNGVISYISQTVDPQTRTITVRAKILNPGNKLKPEMYGNILIKMKEREVLVVNKTAIQELDNDYVVYVKTYGGYKEVTVKLGKESNGIVEIVSGLNPGDKVITHGSFWIKSEYHSE